MKRIVSMILLAALLITGLSFPAESRAESDHPITLTITCDPTPELEGEGTIPDLLFTIRNTGKEDYTLYDAKLFGGYEDDEKEIGGDAFSILAGSSKEFHLTDVPVAEEQLGREIVYRLTWNELETQIDEETGEATFLTHPRETTASITVERFVIPELTVTASCEEPYVRTDETFIVSYTISNDTAFDITGIRLYDPEQSMQTILLPSGELLSGESMTVTAEYKMGAEDMTFRPCIEYLSRRREMKTTAAETLTVANVSVDLLVETELRSATIKGTVFAVMITNRGNRPVTDIRVFDEINTLIEEPFSLGPDENYTVVCTITPAVSSDVVRTVRFHVTATDWFGQEIRIDDPGQYQVVPYVEPDSVRLVLSAVLQSPYYNEDGKLCASVQFIIRNNGDVKIHNAVLKELTLFGDVKTYPELLEGDTYLMQVYQLDGVKELRFQVTAFDPAGEACSSDIVRLDLSGLKELADRKDDAVLVYTQNEYMQDIDTKYTGVLRTATIIGLSVAALCAIICIILYAVEIRIRSKLPGEFEDEMERVLRSTKRRTPKQLFTDAPTEQFGYVAPIKLRNYGELTEEEAKERRELYARRLEETVRKETGKSNVRPQTPVRERVEGDGTRVIPTVRKTAPEPAHPSEAKSEGTQVIPVVRRTAPEPAHSSEPKPDGTRVIPTVRKTAPEPAHSSEAKHDSTQVIPTIRKTTPEPVPSSEPKPEGTRVITTVRKTAPEPAHSPEAKLDGTRVIPVVRRTAPEPAHSSEPKSDSTPVIPVIHPNPVIDPVPQPPVVPVTEESEPIRIFEPRRSHPAADNPPDTQSVPPSLAQGGQEVTPELEPEPEPESVPEPLPEPVPESETEPEQEFEFANTIVGDGVPDVPPEPEPVPIPSMKSEPEPYNPPDTQSVPPSLAQGGQGVVPEPEMLMESELITDSVRNSANTIVGDGVPDVPPEPEPVPEPLMEREPEQVPEPLSEPVPESESEPEQEQ